MPQYTDSSTGITWNYTLRGSNASIGDATGNATTVGTSLSGAITIPSTITDGGVTYNVTGIDAAAFRSCFKITSIIIPDSVTTIGDNAFSRCSGLTSIDLGNSVTTIGDNAFSRCSSLTSITIPDSVTTIGSSAFYKCISLTSVTLPTNPLFTTIYMIGHQAFYLCSKLTSIDLPNSVETIGNSAFKYCSLTSITFPTNPLFTTIANQSFYGCTSLTSIDIPDSVTTIDLQAFLNCSGLTSITIPDSVTSIGNSAFYNIGSPSTVTVKDVVPNKGKIEGFIDVMNLISSKINGEVSYNISSSTISRDHIDISNGTDINLNPSVIQNSYSDIRTTSNYLILNIASTITEIQNETFKDLTNIVQVNMRSVESIGSQAFSGCSMLETIYISNDLSDISENAFQNCSNLKYVYTKPYLDVSSIVFNPSSGTNLTRDDVETTITDASLSTTTFINGTLGYTVQSIEDNAFADIEKLTAMDFSESPILNYIGTAAFRNCSNLKNMLFKITNSTNFYYLGDYAFNGCILLDEVLLPNINMKHYIGYNCFTNTNIKYASLPYELDSISTNSVFPENTIVSYRNTTNNVTTSSFYDYYDTDNIVYHSMDGQGATVTYLPQINKVDNSDIDTTDILRYIIVEEPKYCTLMLGKMSNMDPNGTYEEKSLLKIGSMIKYSYRDMNIGVDYSEGATGTALFHQYATWRFEETDNGGDDIPDKLANALQTGFDENNWKIDINCVDNKGRTALHKACGWSHHGYLSRTHKAISLLVQAKADLNIKDIYGRTPLNYAHHGTDIIALLKNNGATESLFEESFIRYYPNQEIISESSEPIIHDSFAYKIYDGTNNTFSDTYTVNIYNMSNDSLNNNIPKYTIISQPPTQIDDNTKYKYIMEYEGIIPYPYNFFMVWANRSWYYSR